MNATLHIPTCGAVPESSIFYSSMCYGYGNDSYARVVTIVDIHHKQHIFVVPDDPRKSVFQVSDGSWDFYAHEIPSRYFVPQSTIDTVKAHNKAQAQAIHDAKVKAQQDKADLFLACVEKDLKKVDEKKIGSKEHLLPIHGASGVFQAARSANGEMLRNKAGDYFDIQGNCYVLSKDEKTWNVKVLAYGSTSIINVAQPKSTESSTVETQICPPTTPNNTGCGHPDPEWNKPTILDHPMPPIEKPEPLVHPKYEDEQPRNEGCGHKDPELDKIDRTIGCGGLQTPKLTQDDLILQAKINREDLLPRSGDIPFEPKKQKGGDILRDKQGGYIDKYDNAWNWDPIKEEWDVVGKKGHRNVNSEGTETHKGTHPDAKSGTSNSQKNK